MQYQSQKVAYAYFLVAMGLFGIQVLAGLLASWVYVSPNTLSEILLFNVIRMIHTNALIVWLLLGFFGAAYYIVPEESEREIFSVRRAYIQLAIFVDGTLGAVGSYLVGIHGGREFLEQPLWVKFGILVAAVVFLVNVSLTFLAGRKNVELVLPDVVDPVAGDLPAPGVLQPVTRQDHDRADHPRHDVPGDHGAARRAVVDEGPRPRCLEPQDRLFAGVHQRHRTTAKRARGGMEVDVVLQHVVGRVDERQFDVIPFVDDHHRPRNGPVEGHSLQPGVGHVHFLLDDLHLEFDNPGLAGGHLFVHVHVGRRDQFAANTFQLREARRRGYWRKSLFGFCGLGEDGQRGNACGAHSPQ